MNNTFLREALRLPMPEPHYHLLTSRRKIPPFDLTQVADYIVAGDGVLMRIPYLGILMDVPVVACPIRGLAPWATWCEGLVGAHAGDAPEGEDDGSDQPFAPLYHILHERLIPPLDRGRLYEYLVAGNGVFVRAELRGIEVLMPISPPCELVGLTCVEPYVRLPYPRVGPEIVERLLARALEQATDDKGFNEILFYLLRGEGAWEVVEPEQVQSRYSVEPVDKGLAARLGVIAEVHSHHTMRAFFSGTDDDDEKWSGIYCVLGHITSHPELCVRVVIDGYSWPCPASLVFDLPAGVVDASREVPDQGRRRRGWRW
jgi:PRTRC genetic system protein A